MLPAREPIDGHNAGVLELSSDLRLSIEARVHRAAIGVQCSSFTSMQALHRHSTTQILLTGQEDLSHRPMSHFCEHLMGVLRLITALKLIQLLDLHLALVLNSRIGAQV